MAAASQDAGSPTADREITHSRVFDAPRELVFDAMSDPEHISLWWGPRGFTTTTHEMDVRPGGVWRFIMHGPDGVDYPNRIIYSEVVRPERLVYDHDDDGGAGDVRFHVTVTFTEEAGGTRLSMRTLFDSTATRQKMVEFGAVEGGTQTLDRLGEYLATL